MTSARALGLVVAAEHGEPEALWAAIRDLAGVGGLDWLSALRLALGAAELVGDPSGPATVELAVVAGDSGEGLSGVQATIRAGTGSDAELPPGLVDGYTRRTSATGEELRIVIVAAGPERWAPPGETPSAWERIAAGPATGGRLLAAALVTTRERTQRLVACVAENEELRAELEETNRGLLAIHAELSEQREQLERARAEAERANQAKAAFLANMSHEIRSPMNAVIGFTDLLSEGGLTADQAECVEAVRTAGRHLQAVIDDILDLSKVESGRLVLEDTEFDLVACVEEAVGIVTPKAEEKGLPLVALFAPELPVRVSGDPVRLRQILVNLLSNAVKFTQHGEVTLDVEGETGEGETGEGETGEDETRGENALGAETDPGIHQRCPLAFRVRDTGIGIASETIDHLFNPFVQADPSTTRRFGGTGLGLSISRQLAEQMGGGISVASTEGVGSTFTCRATVRQVGPARLGTEEGRRLAGIRALVVHEQPSVVETIRRHLVSWGAEVVTMPSVAAAGVAAADWAGAQLAVATVTGADAETLVGRWLRAAAVNCPTLAVVAVAPLAARHALTGLEEVRALVSTPVRRGQLRDAVLRALERRTEPTDREAERTAGGRRSDSAPAVPVGGTYRVLYVDDDPAIVTLIQRILRRDRDVVVETASRGSAAFELATTIRPSVIMMDLHLPDMNGDALLERLRADARTRSIPTVIVSGDVSKSTISRLTDAGATRYLMKPFDARNLRALIAELREGGRVDPVRAT